MKITYSAILAFMLVVLPIIPSSLYAEPIAVNAPIEITSNSLELLKADSKAIFTGKVEAIQGSMHLHSDKMVVYYVDQMERKKNQAQNAISKIEVFGNVLLTTREETAKGNRGVYRVKEKTLELTGNVLLTKDSNVVKGDYLFYNLATGRSQVTSRSVSPDGTNGTKQRVRGVFVPGAK